MAAAGASALYAVKLQLVGRRETIPLESANSEIAAQKARDICVFEGKWVG